MQYEKIKITQTDKRADFRYAAPAKDLAKGEALVSITGQEEAFIENYKGILECTDESVVIATGRCRIRFQGKHLHVEYYTNEEMKIEGMIQKILFL